MIIKTFGSRWLLQDNNRPKAVIPAPNRLRIARSALPFRKVFMNDQSMTARFGFLVTPINASFDGVSIDPLPDHEQRLDWFSKNANADGFFYPPQIANYTRSGPKKRRVLIPRTERPAAVYHLPASHELSIKAPLVLTHPYSDAVLLTQLLAFIFGTRLQLEEWRFEGRVPKKSMLPASVANEVRIAFVAHAYAWWKTLAPTLRVRVHNVFYAYNRAVATEWDWDAFSQQYMVFDAIYRLHTEITSLNSRSSHKMRFTMLCEAYGIPHNEDLVTKLYNARNELFHESMWASAMIGHQAPGSETVQYPHHLARLNARLLCAITGYKNSFTASAWWAMGQFYFGTTTTGNP